MRRILLLAVMQCAALGALTAPAVVAVSLLVRRMVGDDSAPDVYALVDAAAALTAMIAAPLCGLLADRTMSRLGRRRPWLLGGAVVGLLGSAAMAWAPDPLILAGAWMLTQAGYNAVFAAINGLLAEGLDPADRTRAAGIFSAAAFLGTVPGILAAALLAENVRAMLLVVPVAALAVIVPLALRVPDPPLVGRLPAAPRAPWRRLRAEVAPASGSDAEGVPASGSDSASASASASSILVPSFLAVLALRFLFSLQLSAGLTFALYLFISRWSLAESAAVRATSLSTFTGVVGVVIAAVLLTSSRWRRAPMAPVLGIALALLAAAMLGRALAPTLLVFHLATAVAGLAIGLGMTATRSLAYGMLPAASAGFGLGLMGAAGSLAGLIAPLAAAALLRVSTGWGAADPYAGMYTLLALPALLGLALLPALRTRSAAAARVPQPL